ncbi:hypothetical protein Bbelb_314190 [Branchiostoma belcheri]|nr:hypothetical protein Bbelb_314190 [Branchiostoma belcheri]
MEYSGGTERQNSKENRCGVVYHIKCQGQTRKGPCKETYIETGGDTSYLARMTRYYGHVSLTSRSKSSRVHSVNKLMESTENLGQGSGDSCVSDGTDRDPEIHVCQMGQTGIRRFMCVRWDRQGSGDSCVSDGTDRDPEIHVPSVYRVEAASVLDLQCRSEGVIIIDYLQKGQTINGVYCAPELRQLRATITEKRGEKLRVDVLTMHLSTQHRGQ